MEKSENLRALKSFGTKYFKEELLKPPPKEKEVIVYGKNDLQIGRTIKDGRVYRLDISEACRILVLGATRCCPLDTLVKTKTGYCKIQEAKKVLSYNFEKKTMEEKECIVHNSGLKKLVIIKTSLGEIRCSDNHKCYVKRNKEIILVKAMNLLKTDKLLRVDDEEKIRIVSMELKEVNILNIEITEEEVEMVDLEVKDNHNFFVENNVLLRNSGKTFLLRNLGDRLNQIGKSLVYLNDVKNEFHCVVVTQEVITNNGFKKIKDLDEEKDKILSRDFDKNINKYNSFTKTKIRKADVFEVEFEDGSKIRATGEHRLFYENGNEVRINDIKEGEDLFNKQ